MVHKQQLIQAVIERTHLLLGAVVFVLSPSKLTAGLKNVLDSSIPEGYQDEKGFHFGPKSTAEKANG